MNKTAKEALSILRNCTTDLDTFSTRNPELMKDNRYYTNAVLALGQCRGVLRMMKHADLPVGLVEDALDTLCSALDGSKHPLPEVSLDYWDSALAGLCTTLRNTPEPKPTPVGSFSLNDMVKVFLNDRGEDVLLEHFKKVCGSSGRAIRLIAIDLTGPDASYYKLQVRDLISIFGNSLQGDEGPDDETYPFEVPTFTLIPTQS